MRVQILLVEDSAGLMILRDYKESLFVFVSALLGSVFGLLELVGWFMAKTESLSE